MFLVLILAAWAAGSLLDARQALIALGALLVAGWTVFIRAPDVPATELIWLSIPVVGTFVLSAATARHSERARLAEQRMLEAEEVARRAVEDERNRITRELHDVLAHSVSVMTVQASAVRRLLKPEQEREREALMTVEETGRQALAEMRRLLGIMRTEDGAARARAAAGDRHAPRARRAGAPVGPAGRADGRGHARQAPGRRRPLRIPDRPGGADEHAQARRPGARVGRRPLRRRGCRDRSGQRRQQREPGRRQRPRARRHARARRALRRRAANPARGRAAASRSRRGCRWPEVRREHPGADRRRPGARARRASR